MNLVVYQNKIKKIQERILEHKKSYNRYALIRLAIFITGLILFYIFFSINSLLAFILLGFFVVAFFLALRHQNRISGKLKHLKTLEVIYKNEISVLNEESNLFGDGEEFLDGKHPFSSDLDIFGSHSIFSLINRSLSYEGKNKLAHWLSNGEKSMEALSLRQEAIRELSENENFKEKILPESIHLKKKKIDQRSIMDWFEGFEFSFLRLIPYRIVLHIFSLILLFLIPLSFLYDYAYLALFLGILLSTFINFKYFRKVNSLHGKISKQSEIFANYSRLVSIIYKQSFKAEKLTALKMELEKPDQIIRELRVLSRLIEQLDYRLNVSVAFFLNIFFFWDILKSIRIEKWLKKNKAMVPVWLAPIAELDALLSMSIFHFNHPNFTFPEFEEKEGLYIVGKEIGHPLIPAEKRVCNSYKIEGDGHFDLITGSNMAGKTTFLRTIGVNTVLAQSGCPVCAKELKLSPVRIMTYMRIADSLEYNLSTFHAEIQRIRDILQFAKEDTPVLLLLDELLRGTNSTDRARGTRALINQLIRDNASGMISTHDLSLTEMEKDLPGNIRNFHFDIVNKDNDLDFDYKLKDGVSQTTNAGMLLRKIGLEL